MVLLFIVGRHMFQEPLLSALIGNLRSHLTIEPPFPIHILRFLPRMEREGFVNVMRRFLGRPER